MALSQLDIPNAVLGDRSTRILPETVFVSKQLKVLWVTKGYHAVTIWENRIHDIKHAVSKKVKERVSPGRWGMILQHLTFVLNWRIWVWWLTEGIENHWKWWRDGKTSSRCCDASLSRTGCYIHGWEGGIENRGLEPNSHCKTVLFQTVFKKKSNASFLWHMFENVML